MAGGYRAGLAYADRIPSPRELAPDPGARFIPARDRLASRLQTEIVSEGRALTVLGRPPRGSLVAVTMDYRHPDTEEERRGVLFYETDGDLFRRIRPEIGGYAGPAFRAMATAFRGRAAYRTAARLEDAARYRLDSDVRLSLRAERRLSSVADGYHARTGRRLAVTSGTRDAAEQARAMYTKLVLGDDVVKLYGGRPLVHEIVAAYDAGTKANRSGRDIQRAMADTIRAQIARGEYISSHLRAGAVDIRSRGITDAQKAKLRAAARAVPNVRLSEETTPPHFHMQVRDPEP